MMKNTIKRYNEYKTRIKLLEIEIDDCISLGSKNLDDPLPGKVSARSNKSVVEKQAELIEEYQEELRQLKKEIKKVDAVLAGLPKDDADIIRLRYMDGVSVVNIAWRLNLSRQAVYYKLQNAMLKVNQYASNLHENAL